MVAINAAHRNQVLLQTTTTGPEEHQKLSPKQLKRLEEQRAREAKKMARRTAKALQKERKAAEREQKEAMRELRLEKEREANLGLCAREMEAKERLAEQKRLFEEEFLQEEKVLTVRHVKKSVQESNRLGGTHMC
mmetsp:Transcript_101705/g.206676  ORF Transcript_101705/g.206676 Transcript_101705/m.206676 type:complete len:135 (+) Transcript_101705:100-504(+)